MLDNIIKGDEILKIGENLINKYGEVKKELEDLELKMKEYELVMKINIENEVDENGKKVYSNENKREIEYINRIKNDNVYMEMKRNRLSLVLELKKIDMYINYVNGKVSGSKL